MRTYLLEDTTFGYSHQLAESKVPSESAHRKKGVLTAHSCPDRRHGGGWEAEQMNKNRDRNMSSSTYAERESLAQKVRERGREMTNS